MRQSNGAENPISRAMQQGIESGITPATGGAIVAECQARLHSANVAQRTGERSCP
jgi:hypothetical protein